MTSKFVFMKVGRSYIKRILSKSLPGAWYDLVLVNYWRVRNINSSNYELECQRLCDFISPGDWVVDVGVNMGQYAAVLARAVGPAGRVIGFEASFSTYALASKIVRKRHVHLYNLAIGSAETTLTLGRYADSSGLINSGISHITTVDDPDASEFESVDCVTLDSFLSDRSQAISFIKCDVEGFELSVIAGALEIISADRPLLLVEILDEKNFISVLAAFEPFNYRVFQISPTGKWCRLESFGDSRVCNYLFVPFEKRLAKS
ncbi:MAG: hypothetical protein CMN84_09220 [Spongiibacteraceae bacterium]|nr:hypothetical protein [Spongiibacteraceae bacterium]